MNRSQDRQTANAPGHSANQGQPGQAAAPGEEERYQTTREHAPTDQGRQSADSSPAGSKEGHPAEQEREERIRRRAYQLWEDGGRQDGHAEDDWHRAAQDLDREDADLQPSLAGKSATRNRS